MLNWIEGEPPKDDKTYLLQYITGVICSGRYRLGNLGEPQQGQKYWRCDCCGRFATPIRYVALDGGER